MQKLLGDAYRSDVRCLCCTSHLKFSVFTPAFRRRIKLFTHFFCAPHACKHTPTLATTDLIILRTHVHDAASKGNRACEFHLLKNSNNCSPCCHKVAFAEYPISRLNFAKAWAYALHFLLRRSLLTTSAHDANRHRCKLPFCRCSTYRACDKLRCTACNFEVLCFKKTAWDDSTDYLYLRNNFPDAAKLRPKLRPCSGGMSTALKMLVAERLDLVYMSLVLL